MRDHHSAVGNFRRDVTEPPSDVFVRQAVKSVAANALRVERFGNGKAVRYVIDGKMENIGAFARFITGTWTQGSVKGPFKITRT